MPKSKRKAVKKSPPASKKSTRSRTRATKATSSRNVAGRRTAAASEELPLFFWKETEREVGFLSPWYKCTFINHGVSYESAGHALMAEKARLFGDKDTLKLINASKSASEHRLLGGNVKGFDEEVWAQEALKLATQINVRKFLYGNGSETLQERLSKTGSRELVLTSLADRLFGIGLSSSEAAVTDRAQWGKNVFGKSLVATRRRIRRRVPVDTSVFDKPGSRLNIYW